MLSKIRPYTDTSGISKAEAPWYINWEIKLTSTIFTKTEESIFFFKFTDLATSASKEKKCLT